MPQEGASVTAPLFRRGDRAILHALASRGDERRRHLVELTGEAVRVADLGILDTARLEGRPHGATYTVGTELYRLLPPSTLDLIDTIRRKAQIVTPKDAAQILLLGDVVPGARVVEAGIGSAALTIAIARAVGPEGRVYSYEIRQDFQKWGRDNLERAGLLDRVVFHLGDITEGIEERGVDAIILDLPSPWLVVRAAAGALRPGGTLVGYTPLVSQMEQTVRALRENGFFDVEAREILERRMVVSELGSRPDFSMLGHTGYLTVGRSTGHSG